MNVPDYALMNGCSVNPQLAHLLVQSDKLNQYPPQEVLLMRIQIRVPVSYVASQSTARHGIGEFLDPPQRMLL